MAYVTNPVLSVVVAIASDTTSPSDVRHLGPCLASLRRQTGAPPMEIIVPHPPAMIGIEALRRQYPEVCFLAAAGLKKYDGRRGSREHHGELLARGLAQVRGAIVALIEDNDVAAPEWSAQVLEAHRRPYAGVGGAIENGIDLPLNWAVYFCDFLRYQNPLPEGESQRASDANVSYKRAALEAIRPIWSQEFHEASVNGALRARGEKIAMAPAAIVYQRRQGLRLASALKERSVWGRSFGAWRTEQAGARQRLFWILFSPGLPILLIARMSLMAWRKRRTRAAFFRALPLTAGLTVSWSCGELIGYITGGAHSAGFGEPEAQALGSKEGL